MQAGYGCREEPLAGDWLLRLWFTIFDEKRELESLTGFFYTPKMNKAFFLKSAFIGINESVISWTLINL